jgi:hypothetical protein
MQRPPPPKKNTCLPARVCYEGWQFNNHTLTAKTKNMVHLPHFVTYLFVHYLNSQKRNPWRNCTCFLTYKAYHYFAEDTTYAVWFREMVSINNRNVIKTVKCRLTGNGLGGSGLIPSNARFVSSLQRPDRLGGDNLASYEMGTDGSFPGGRAAATRMVELHLHSPISSWRDV